MGLRLTVAESETDCVCVPETETLWDTVILVVDVVDALEVSVLDCVADVDCDRVSVPLSDSVAVIVGVGGGVNVGLAVIDWEAESVRDALGGYVSDRVASFEKDCVDVVVRESVAEDVAVGVGGGVIVCVPLAVVVSEMVAVAVSDWVAEVDFVAVDDRVAEALLVFVAEAVDVSVHEPVWDTVREGVVDAEIVAVFEAVSDSDCDFVGSIVAVGDSTKSAEGLTVIDVLVVADTLEEAVLVLLGSPEPDALIVSDMESVGVADGVTVGERLPRVDDAVASPVPVSDDVLLW